MYLVQFLNTPTLFARFTAEKRTWFLITFMFELQSQGQMNSCLLYIMW